ncbi:MAG TPA: hypothetical protein VE378_02490 [Nitrososphaeraceae archaeon]|nr:hypothetical protein [Nitrososphaeraceae archaeon]
MRYSGVTLKTVLVWSAVTLIGVPRGVEKSRLPAYVPKKVEKKET